MIPLSMLGMEDPPTLKPVTRHNTTLVKMRMSMKFFHDGGLVSVSWIHLRQFYELLYDHIINFQKSYDLENYYKTQLCPCCRSK